MQLILYTTLHCHLCELAYALVYEATEYHTLKLIDIANDDALLEDYGTRIPVLQRSDNQSELSWPFNLSDIIAFIKS